MNDHLLDAANTSVVPLASRLGLEISESRVGTVGVTVILQNESRILAFTLEMREGWLDIKSKVRTRQPNENWSFVLEAGLPARSSANRMLIPIQFEHLFQLKSNA